MPTTTNGIPYPAPTDPPNSPLQMQQLAEFIDLLMKDTNWIALPAAAGITGTLRYRQIGRWMTVQVDVNNATTVSGTMFTISAAPHLPAAYRPSTVAVRQSGYFWAGPGNIMVDNVSGAVQAMQTLGANRTAITGTVVYPLG